MKRIQIDKCEYCIDYVYDDEDFQMKLVEQLLPVGNEFEFKRIPAVWHTKCEDDEKLLEEVGE